MSEGGPADRGRLLDIFLLEAWETTWRLAAGARQLTAGAVITGLHADLPLFAHRLRGSAALYGFPALSELAGRIEDVLGRLGGAGSDERRQAAERLGALVESLRTMLRAIEQDGAEDAAQGAQALDRYLAAPRDIPAYFASEAGEQLDVIASAMLALDRPEPDTDAVPALLRTVHTLKGAAYTVGCHPVGDLAHRLETLLIGLRDGQASHGPAAVAAIGAGVAALRGMISADAAARERSPALLQHALTALRTCTTETAPPALPVSPSVREDHGPVAPPPIRPSLRVPLECLDSLLDLVGEFVSARSRLERHVAQLERIDELLVGSAARLTRVVRTCEVDHDSMPVRGPIPPGPQADLTAAGHALIDLFAELEFDRYSDFTVLARSVREIAADVSETRAQLRRTLDAVQQEAAASQGLGQRLRGDVMRARMIPVGRLFERFPRQVEETSQAEGKTVTLETSGTGVEIDSAVIEQIADPLLHLVQNAIVHGLEPAEERRAAGKSADGTIHLRAHHEHGAVCVDVEDDGRGIDMDAVRVSAIARGLIDARTASLVPEHELLNMIFLPGFTTAAQVTAASGRGIGLDVVRTHAARVHGDVEVITQRGAGTRFRLRFPLTVLIADVLLIGSGGETFAVPIDTVQQIVTVSRERIQSAGEQEMVWIRDQLVDLIRLDRSLALPVSAPGRELPLLVVRARGRSLAVAVDEVRSKDQVVIKSLGGFPQGIGPFSSGTISSDGRVILVLDPARLLQTSGRPSTGEDRPPAARPPRTETLRRCLLVDDSISVRKFVGQMLERAGFDVVTASNGIEALQQIENTAIHVVITDLEMPQGNGYELIETLRRRPSTRDLPIVVLTTRGGAKHQELARRLGVEHYLTKPVDEAAFVALIASLVSRPTPATVECDGP